MGSAPRKKDPDESTSRRSAKGAKATRQPKGARVAKSERMHLICGYNKIDTHREAEGTMRARRKKGLKRAAAVRNEEGMYGHVPTTLNPA